MALCCLCLAGIRRDVYVMYVRFQVPTTYHINGAIDIGIMNLGLSVTVSLLTSWRHCALPLCLFNCHEFENKGMKTVFNTRQFAYCQLHNYCV